jgi:hypothetical protein
MTKHAVYAIHRLPAGGSVGFRIGQPVEWVPALSRWDRLDTRRINGRRPVVRANRRQYPIDFLEVREVDRHGRGLGSERHTSALQVPYRAVRVTR